MNILDTQTFEDDLSSYYLSFRIAKELFAIEVKNVIEILEVPSITKVPKAPVFMAGVVNLKGRVLPLVDMKIKLGLQKTEFTVDTCVVVLELTIIGRTMQVGVLVDSVSEVMEIQSSDIQPAPGISSKSNLNYIAGIFRKNEDFVMLLNLEEIFSNEEVISIKKINRPKNRLVPTG